MNNLPCLFSSGIGSTSRVVRFLKLNRHSNSVNNSNGSLNQRVVVQQQQRSSFVTVRPSKSLAEQQQKSLISKKSSNSTSTFGDFFGSKRSFSLNQTIQSRSQSASRHLLSQSSSVQRSVNCSSSMAPIIVNYESYLNKLVSDTRVLIFSKSTCPFCLKVRHSHLPLLISCSSPLSLSNQPNCFSLSGQRSFQ